MSHPKLISCNILLFSVISLDSHNSFRVCRYIDEYDLKRFLIKEEVDIVFPMIDVAETGQIDRKALTEWVVCSVLNHFFWIMLYNLM